MKATTVTFGRALALRSEVKRYWELGRDELTGITTGTEPGVVLLEFGLKVYAVFAGENTVLEPMIENAQTSGTARPIAAPAKSTQARR